MDDLTELSGALAKRTQSDYGDWLKALKCAQSGLANVNQAEKAIQTLAEASASPLQFRLLAEALAAHCTKNPGDKKDVYSLLIESVNESPYSLSEWLGAWEFFSQWLAKRNRKGGFAVMLGYLDCCSQYIEGKGVIPTFNAQVEEMLEAYGFEGEDGDCS